MTSFLFYKNSMKSKIFQTTIPFCLLSMVAVSQNVETAQPKEETPKKETIAVIKPYGFIRNYFTFDSRESKSGTGDLYYYLPCDESIQADGTDINAHPTMKWSAITSRLGFDVKGYEYGNFSATAKIEADFYSGVSGVTGTATFRLRQAYALLQWAGNGDRSSSLKIGQAWHPMAADMIHGTSLEIGVPFGPFSRTPLITYDYTLNKSLSFTASALWQMQYTSEGPEGSSANYMKYSNIPEGYLGVSFTKKDFVGRVGVDVLSIKPRYKGTVISSDGMSYTGFVSDKVTTISPFVYLQYEHKNISVKAKSILAEAGEHMNLLGGYGVSEKFTDMGEDGHWEYTPTRVSSSLISLSYKTNKWQYLLFGGYAQNFGTKEHLFADDTIQGVAIASVANNYLAKNTYANVNSMWRIAPGVVRSWGKFAVAFEWQITSAQYGQFFVVDKKSYVNAENGLAEENLHWITNHRLQMMVKYTF